MSVYTITVNGKSYAVSVTDGASAPVPAKQPVQTPANVAQQSQSAEALHAPLAGTIWKINAMAGLAVTEGEGVLILEAFKLETEIRATKTGVIQQIHINEGDAVEVGEPLLTIA